MIKDDILTAQYLCVFMNSKLQPIYASRNAGETQKEKKFDFDARISKPTIFIRNWRIPLTESGRPEVKSSQYGTGVF